jgi:hypothetical protein
VSQENVELHRLSVSAFNSRDAEGYVALADPHVEIHSVLAAVGGGSYYGPDGVRSWFRDLQDAWGDEVRYEVEEYFDLGERTLSFGMLRGRGRQSGADVVLAGYQAMTWRGGVVIHFKAYPDKDICLKELGVSEAQLEPIAP